MKNSLGEWLYISGVVLITVMLIDVMGAVRATIFGCGVALIAGGIIRIIKNQKK